MWAANIYDPSFVMIVAPGSGAWRVSQAQFRRGMKDRKRHIRARQRGHLIDVHHLRYDPLANVATTGRDCIGRRVLTIGPMLTAALALQPSGSGDLIGDLDSLFLYRDDADRAVPDVARLARRDGARIEFVAA